MRAFWACFVCGSENLCTHREAELVTWHLDQQRAALKVKWETAKFFEIPKRRYQRKQREGAKVAA